MAVDGSGNGTGSVLVTRPVGEAAEGLCRAVSEAGFAVYHQPLLSLAALPQLSGAQRGLIQNLDNYHHVIFISANAVRFGMARIEDYWPQLPTGINWYAIGEATAKLLEQSGIKAMTPGCNMSSEGLLAVPRLQDVAGQRVLIIKGEGGRNTLASELTSRGAQVDALACYRRSCPRLEGQELASKMRVWGIGVVLISSGEGLANLLTLLSPAETTKFKHLCLIVPSGRVALQARDAGFDQLVTADNASDAAMLSALQQWKLSSGD